MKSKSQARPLDHRGGRLSKRESLTPEQKLHRYLELASSVRVLVDRVVAEGSRARQAGAQGLAIRDRVLIGLSIKAFNCFECLIQDAAALRSEAFHHLKTLAETHIYFQWVGVNMDDRRAQLLLAEVCRCKIGFYDASPELDPDRKDRENLKRSLQAWIAGLENEWKRFKKSRLRQLAEETNADMVGWYNRSYKPACEPAHISDLSEYMPPERGSISIAAPPRISTLRALIALDYGLQIMWDLLRNLSGIYELSFDESITKLKAKVDATRSVTTSQ